MTRHTATRARQWLAVEVVQSSSMDCGPAALKCLMEGFGAPVSYGRLREACQTSVDGTSIDTLEVVAGQLGLAAEQVLIPLDHATLPAAGALPAIVVVRHAEAATHFVVVWRRVGAWLQVMDPALGRRWVRADRFQEEIFRHEMSLEARDWREWAATEAFLAPLRVRLDALAVRPRTAARLIAEALSAPGWFPIGAFDAAVRLVQSVVSAGGVHPGREAEGMVAALFRTTRDSAEDIFTLIPGPYWSVVPDAGNTDPSREMLRAAGAVMLRVEGRLDPALDLSEDTPPLSLELAAALSERPDAPIRTLWKMLREDGLLAPLALMAAMAVASGAVMLEALLFRGLFDIAGLLNLASQRAWAAGALLAFLLIMTLAELSIGLEAGRHGRQLETRLRMALLRKLPRLNDRYFQSRPLSDMADRSHNIHLIRSVPGLALGFLQSIFELGLTLAGILLIAPDSAVAAVLTVLVAMVIPLVVQPMLNERDLRVRNHAGALHGFYLDALLGLAPVRAHRAERSVRRQHESLLVEWALSLRGWVRMGLMSDAAQSILCTTLAGALLIGHFRQQGAVHGSDLLLVFWAMKLPSIGGRLAGFAHQYPAQRNVLLRLLEPLNAPEDLDAPHPASALPAPLPAAGAGVRIVIEDGRTLAGGHEILRDLNLTIAPGEHVAIVGVSGSGKSSLLGLLLGWHRLAEGRLTLDGAPATTADIEVLRQTTAWVDPGIQIWNRSLLENLAYAADDDGLSRVGEVIQAARLRRVAETLPTGLQTLLGEGGGRLSGGEGQRVRLGRALLAGGTRLALLDEPFRGLDRAQRHDLLQEARSWWRDTTLLCVTHDVSETRTFERVLVVEDGRIVEDGAPMELIAGPTRYRQLLGAEYKVAERLWKSNHWRRIEMAGGQVRGNGAWA